MSVAPEPRRMSDRPDHRDTLTVPEGVERRTDVLPSIGAPASGKFGSFFQPGRLRGVFMVHCAMIRM